MEWFSGSVKEAVVAANQNNSHFVVYVEGHDESSQLMTSVINSDEISALFESNKCICVQIKINTEEYNQFVNIYEHVPVPSLFLIGVNGTPISIVKSLPGEDKDSLRQQIITKFTQKDNTALSKDNLPYSQSRHKLQLIRERNDSVVSDLASETSDFLVKESEELFIAKEIPFSSSSLVVEFESEETKDDSKNTQNRKSENNDFIIQEIQQERIRNAKDRQRILNDIAIDKQERQLRKLNMDNYTSIAPNSVSRISNSVVPAITFNQTRIQFRKPDGTTCAEIFNTENVLNDLHMYIIRTMHINARQFKLGTAFPRHIFTEEERNKSLEELNLVPNAVIIVIINSENDTPAGYVISYISATLWYVVSPFTSLCRFIKNSIFRVSQPQITNGILRRSQTGTSNQSDSSQNRKTLNQLQSVAHGNVRTMANINKDKDKDRNNVWNGNSTQQSQ